MLIPNQFVKVKWNGNNKQHYMSLGYTFTNLGDEFEIKCEDLSKYSKVEIKLLCDYCLEDNIKKEIIRPYYNYIRYNTQSKINKDSCKSCSYKKLKELHQQSYSDDFVTDDEIQDEIPLFENGYSKEYLIGEFWRYVNEFNTYPRLVDFKSTKGYPDASAYNRIWGNWTEFLKSIGVLNNNGWFASDEKAIVDFYKNRTSNDFKNLLGSLMKNRSVKEVENKASELGLVSINFFKEREYDLEDIVESSFNGLKHLYDDLGKCPNVEEYERYAKLNKLLHRKALEKNTGMKFATICKTHINENNKDTKSNEQLLEELVNLINMLGRVPLGSELVKYGLSERKTYQRKLGKTFQEIITDMDLELSSAKRLYKSDEELLSDYYNLYKKLGRIPLMGDISQSDIASYNTYKKRFGGILSIWELLGLDYSDININSLGRGFTCFDDNGEVCRSEAEMKITNLLIKNNITFNKEVRYTDLLSNKFNTWRMDWYLPNDDIVVEYFGLYSETQLKKKTKIGKYSRKVNRKINFCKENNLKIISIFPEDIKNGLDNVLKKFKDSNIHLVI